MTHDDMESLVLFVNSRADLPYGGIPVICACCSDDNAARHRFRVDISAFYLDYLCWLQNQIEDVGGGQFGIAGQSVCGRSADR